MQRTNLSPFAHDCHEPPRAGADPCDACRWAREKLASEVVKSYALRPDYSKYELFQIGVEELGLA